MPKIKEDRFGLYVSAGGYKTRPVKPSQFVVGNEVKVHHYGGSTRVGIGKSPECKRGEYQEYWLTTCDTSSKIDPVKEEMLIAWYKVYACDFLFTRDHTEEDKRLAQKYQEMYINPR